MLFRLFNSITILNRTAHQLASKTLPTMKRLSLNDPNSFSNPESILVKHMKLNWYVDFSRKIISGSVDYTFDRFNKSADKIILDTRALKINGATDGQGKKLDFSIGDEVGPFGQALEIVLNNSTSLKINYETTENCTALQWLDKQQTMGKRHPYVFSQCQAIHARSLLPCQDTPFVKASYEAEVKTETQLQTLMSAVLQPTSNSSPNTFNFKQNIPIPSYLIAIAVGDIKGKKIGPRSTVWTEQEQLEMSAKEFEDTEKFVEIGEKLMGKYVWGVYDILVLPPSFPYGGMENPCLTFATPTLLAGDKSLVNVIAHEISHSWTGNLVTNKNWEHFWLNEGFTAYAERLILREMYSEKTRQFAFIGGWKVLSDTIKTRGQDDVLTKLVVDLTGVDPDDSFSSVPYEKGSCLLYYLETLVGTENFIAFFKSYIQKFQSKSIETKDFINYFEKNFPSIKMDWDTWLNTFGMPPIKPEYDTTLSEMCSNLATKWLNTNGPFSSTDLAKFETNQIIEFLSIILDNEVGITLEKVIEMEKLYKFDDSKNCEVLFCWYRLCTRANHNLDKTLAFLTTNGRMKYVRPLYRELNSSNNRAAAIEHFKKTRDIYFPICANLLCKDLKI